MQLKEERETAGFIKAPCESAGETPLSILMIVFDRNIITTV